MHCQWYRQCTHCNATTVNNVPVLTRKAWHIREAEAQLHSFLTLVLDGDEGLASCIRYFTMVIRVPIPTGQSLGWPHRQYGCLEKRKSLGPAGPDLHTLKPIAYSLYQLTSASSIRLLLN